MRLLPREEKFYVDFLAQVQILAETVEVLRQGVNGGGAEMEKAAAKISDLEQKGDSLIHGIMLRLNKTFITPIDPEDIHLLATRLDDVLDSIEEAAHSLAHHGLSQIPGPVKTLVEVIAQQVTTIQRAVDALSTDKPVHEHCVELNRLENEADQIYRAAIASLYCEETNAIQIIKLKQIYEYLEVTTDYCEDVAEVLEQVVVKNG